MNQFDGIATRWNDYPTKAAWCQVYLPPTAVHQTCFYVVFIALRSPQPSGKIISRRPATLTLPSCCRSLSQVGGCVTPCDASCYPCVPVRPSVCLYGFVTQERPEIKPGTRKPNAIFVTESETHSIIGNSAVRASTLQLSLYYIVSEISPLVYLQIWHCTTSRAGKAIPAFSPHPRAACLSVAGALCTTLMNWTWSSICCMFGMALTRLSLTMQLTSGVDVFVHVCGQKDTSSN